jgi:hypothetical protein
VNRHISPIRALLAGLFLGLLGALYVSVFPRPASGETGFYIQPYLQNVHTTGVTVQWWTNTEDGPDQVEFGPGFNLVASGSQDHVASVGRVLHRAVITGLEPETIYPYRVRSGDLVSDEYQFTTAVKRSSPFRFAILGDGRTDDDEVIARHRGIARVALDLEPNFALEAGDYVDTGEQVHWDRLWRRILTSSDPDDPGLDFASRIPFYLLVGNHEIYGGGTLGLASGYAEGNLESTMDRYRAYVDNPPNGSSTPDWEERYYTFSYGVATFIVLDANNTSDDGLDNHDFLPDGSTPDWEPGSEQYQWMIRTLATARDSSAFTFVLMHPSPYSKGTHGMPTEVQNGWKIRALDPVFREYGVDAVLTSHDHVAERSLTGPSGFELAMDDQDPANLNYLVMGNSGHSARGPREDWESWMDITGNDAPPYYTRYFYDWQGTDHASFIDVSIRPLGEGQWEAGLQFMRDDGQIFDPIALRRADPLQP